MMLRVYLSYNVRTIVLMYRKHKHAFRTHAHSLIPLFTLTGVSILTFIGLQTLNLQWRSCIHQQTLMCESWNKPLGGRFDCHFQGSGWRREWVNENSYCHWLFDWNTAPVIGQSAIQMYLIETVFVYLVPVWAFYLFTVPHDCYKCLGKDPDRVFSIF